MSGRSPRLRVIRLACSAKKKLGQGCNKFMCTRSLQHSRQSASALYVTWKGIPPEESLIQTSLFMLFASTAPVTHVAIFTGNRPQKPGNSWCDSLKKRNEPG